MNKIKFNNTEFTVESYSRYINFSEENINSTATCSLVVDDVAALTALGQTTITSLQIIHDNDVIYDLQNIEAHIDNINEYFTGETMSVNINLTFDIE